MRSSNPSLEIKLKIKVVDSGQQFAGGGHRLGPSIGRVLTAGLGMAGSSMMCGRRCCEDHVLDGLVELAVGSATFIVAADQGEDRRGSATGFARCRKMRRCRVQRLDSGHHPGADRHLAGRTEARIAASGKGPVLGRVGKHRGLAFARAPFAVLQTSFRPRGDFPVLVGARRRRPELIAIGESLCRGVVLLWRAARAVPADQGRPDKRRRHEELPLAVRPWRRRRVDHGERWLLEACDLDPHVAGKIRWSGTAAREHVA